MCFIVFVNITQLSLPKYHIALQVLDFRHPTRRLHTKYHKFNAKIVHLFSTNKIEIQITLVQTL